MMLHPHNRIPQPRPELPGLTPAVRGNWQSIGNAGVVCQCMAWALCVFGPHPEGSQYGLILSLLGICAFLAEFYGRLRYRKRQLPFPPWYSLTRYIGFCEVTAAFFLQYSFADWSASVLLLGCGVLLVWRSIGMEKAQRRRLRAQRELEEN